MPEKEKDQNRKKSKNQEKTPRNLTPEEEEKKLQDLKNMVQGEIDKIKTDENGNPADWNKLVNDAKAEQKTKAAHDKKLAGAHKEDLCILCGTELKAEGHDYCEACLEKVRRDKISPAAFIIPLIIIAALILGCYKAAVSISLFRTAAQAQSYADNGYLLTALDKYDNYTTELKVYKKTPGRKVLIREVKLYEKLGIAYYNTLSTFIDDNFAGKDIEKFPYKSVGKAQEKIDDYSAAYTACYSAYSTNSSWKTFLTAVDKAAKSKDLDPSLVAYYKYYVALVYGKSYSVQLKYLNEMKAQGDTYESVYLPCYAELYLGQKKYSKVFSTCDEMLTYNKQDVYAYVYRTAAYRLKGEYAKAYKTCSEGLKIAGDDPLLCYQMSIIELLYGKNDLAFKYAKIAYEDSENEFSYLQASSLYALCAYIKGDTTTYDSINSDVTSNGYTIADQVTAYENGKTDVKTIFTTNGGDFTWTASTSS